MEKLGVFPGKSDENSISGKIIHKRKYKELLNHYHKEGALVVCKGQAEEEKVVLEEMRSWTERQIIANKKAIKGRALL